MKKPRKDEHERGVFDIEYFDYSKKWGMGQSKSEETGGLR